ncbi:uncharacterized small membrane protein [Aequorivita sublithincola DSM 14238]|uniref:Uncharacterized small membrane protein n=1 Tax=Aequorivita sublithincola (strain DSM 14238 / LMG 21431 / ACAM 643 / 9-3) TaxID=746697 RepID=I3YV99_AEQSU|nr:DUF423 domain-containing protein [Aequorivita sublithincola]AFL80917.1 uncharacterized small membrane protein [Aequorivita sublithincola DSM 14238]
MTVLDKNIAATGAIIMAITIAIGAFGAHGLKELLDASALNTFEVGVRYQMYHGLAILILGLAPSIPNISKKKVFSFFLVGILFFSGSIYLLSLDSIIPFETSVIGFVTPLGGLLFIIGWILLAYGILTLKKR